jgi:hypothetical protein
MTTITLQPASGTDTFISSSAPTQNYNLSESMRVQPFGGTFIKRGLLAFDMSSITGSVIAGTLSLYLGSLVTAGTFTVNVHEVSRSWTLTGANWTQYDGANNWSSAGADYGTLVLGSASVGTADRWYDFPLNASVVEGWRTTNNGMILKGSAENLDPINDRYFIASNHGSTDLKPKLTIEYAGGQTLDLTSKIW